MKNKKIGICKSNIVHKEIIDKVREKIPDESSLFQLSELFKVFGDSTRVRILCALFISEMCVCDIAALSGMTQSSISHQLRILKISRLVKFRKEGKIVYYSLNDSHIKDIFKYGLEHIQE
jgi:ArsR family transcriptional regulator, lead/cadmium/zinc/bismuth-responsive transcriptional repressor